jgi:hypothetical protein
MHNNTLQYHSADVSNTQIWCNAETHTYPWLSFHQLLWQESQISRVLHVVSPPGLVNGVIKERGGKGERRAK